MLFSRILDSMRRDGTSFSADVPEDWLQGRTVFGGLQAAIALRAMREMLSPELPLRVLQTTFIAPVPAGTVRVAASVLRTGKNATHVEARFVDGGSTLAISVGVFGRARPSKVRVVPEPPPRVAAEPLRIPFMPGLSPSFVRHFELRWLAGAPPFSGSTSPKAVIEVDLEDEGPTGVEHLLAIADSIPPVALSLLDAPAPGSSLTWTVEMIDDAPSELPLRGYRLDAEVVAGHDGYTSQSVMVWGPHGEPVLLSRQSMVVFG